MSDFWPHVFTKKGKEIQIGEEQFTDHTTRALMAQPMICVHCHIEFVQGKEQRPLGQCPARNDKREMKRLGL